MTKRRIIALGIADALIAGPRDANSARLRCERALASRARWIGRLAQEMVRSRDEVWRDTRRNEIANAIEQSSSFDTAWRSIRPPRLRNFPLASPRMAPLPPALLDCVVPDLPTPSDIAHWLDLDITELEWLTGPLQRPLREGMHATHYHYRWLPKRSGGLRLLEIPKARLRTIQHRILRGILEYVPPHEAAHGFRERHSCVTNARPHVAQAVVMRMDLEDFFGSIGGGKVYEFFAALGYPAAAARALTRLTTCATPRDVWTAERLPSADGGTRDIAWRTRKRLASAHLPQGAPTSPALANLCAFNCDVRVQALADKFGVQYTRYADDLTFSGGEELARRSRTFEAHVGAIALEEGLHLNHRKTRVMRAASRQRVTGIVVNRTPNIPRENFDRLKATLHNCLRHGANTQCESGIGEFRNHLAGHIAHLLAIHPVRGARLWRMFNDVRWNIATETA
jgi:RNA-directed DNA polymerase